MPAVDRQKILYDYVFIENSTLTTVVILRLLSLLNHDEIM